MSHLLPGYQGAALFGRRAPGIDPGREGGLTKFCLFFSSLGWRRSLSIQRFYGGADGSDESVPWAVFALRPLW
jgi:hypothetical protein